MWRIAGLIVVAIVALMVLGAVIRALRWLLYVALLLALVSAVVGWFADSDLRRERRR